MTNPDAELDQAEIIFDEDGAKFTDSPGASLEGEGTAMAIPGTIIVTTHLWFTWLSIAVGNLRDARQARIQLERYNTEGRQRSSLPGQDPLHDEFTASYVAIVAAALALDALYGSTVIPPSARTAHPSCPLDDSSVPARMRLADALASGEPSLVCGRKDRAEARAKIVRSGLKKVFKTARAEQEQKWPKNFKKLFQLRNDAVHAGEAPAEPVPHPKVGMTSVEVAKYKVEDAEHAVYFALSVFRWCIDHPLPKLEDAEVEPADWAAGVRPLVDQLYSRLPTI